MKEILFRALDTITKKMVFGSLRVEKNKSYILTDDYSVDHDIPEYHHQGMGCGVEDRGIQDRYEAARYGFETAIEEFSEMIPTWIEVIPETVGQYTGLTDKNGVKVFEGDVIKHLFITKYLTGTVIYEKTRYKLKSSQWSIYDLDCVEVIGNIHDGVNHE